MKIWAWGANSNAQLGLGFTSEQESVPTEVKLPLASFLNPDASKNLIIKDICGGASHTLCLAITQNKDNEEQEKQLFNNIPFETIKVSETFEILCCPKGLLSEKIASGFDSNFCIIQNGQHLQSCGDNSYFQLGRKIGNEELKQNQGTSSLKTNNHSKKTFTKFWGVIDYEELNTTYAKFPGFKSISPGLRHVAAISICKDLYIWGDNSKFQAGIYQTGPTGQDVYPTRIEKPTKVEFPPSFKFFKVACGKDFTIAVHISGCLFGCGRNKFGVLLHAPQDVQEFKKFTHIFDRLVEDEYVFDIKCGWSHVLVLLSNGRVMSWGRNNFGQLGRSSVNPDFDVEPSYIDFPERIVSIRCGSEHNLALSVSGKVYAWGWNEHDNCGVNKTITEKDQEIDDIMVLEQLNDSNKPTSSSASWRKDCILFPTLVTFPEDVSISVIGCGAGSSFAIS